MGMILTRRQAILSMVATSMLGTTSYRPQPSQWTIRDARWDVVSRALKVMEEGFRKKLDDGNWDMVTLGRSSIPQLRMYSSL